MSGVELAGLILGAFPILIHALESYRESAELLVDWWRIQRAYKKCRQELSYHQILFEGNVQRFLLPLVVDEEELNDLMANPAGARWEDQELEDRLQDRLPKGYALFLDIIRDINSLVETLKKDLGVNNPDFQARVSTEGQLIKSNVGRSDMLSLKNFEFQAKRLKFSLKKNSRERVFSQLQEAGDRMRNLLESSDQVAAARQRRCAPGSSTLVYRKLKDFWRHAQRLHHALTKAWHCACISHVANLGLEHRTCEKVEFDVVFDLTSAGKRHTKIRVSEEVQRHGPRTIRQNPAISLPARRQVRLIGPEPAPDPSQNLNPINDLCATLSTQFRDCIGFLEEDEHRFVVYPDVQDSSTHGMQTKSLQDLLTEEENFTRRKRYCLALTLASSYLQLGATPWLNTELRKESIIFLQDPVNEQATLLDHPYIRREMISNSSSQPTDAIASLGIRLLELCFGKPLEATKFRKQLPSGDPAMDQYLDYAAAIQWSKRAGEEAGPQFAEAIDWCLHAKELSDGSWRTELLQHVIIPLDTCHKQMSRRQ